MEEYLPLIIQLVSGAVGGNVAGKFLKNLSLGTAGNSILGIIGGFGGGKLLEMLTGAEGAGEAVAASADAATSSGLDLTGILSNVGGGAAGGGVLTAIIGAVKNAVGKK